MRKNSSSRWSWSAGLILFAGGAIAACAAGGDETPTDDGNCAVGSETCACTKGGACDPGLECLSNICVDPNSSPQGSGGAGTGGSGGATVSTGSGGQTNCETGCQAIDVVFALDSSASMIEENNALAASSAFEAVVNTIAGVNCGDIDYRIAVTNDYNPSWYVPMGWSGAVPWFDSASMTQNEIVNAFGGAAQVVSAGQSTPAGCEHVLTNAHDALLADATGFVREGALLVLVLVTDVDDYGAYDQLGGNTCGLGCTESVTPVSTLYGDLVGLKGDDPAAVSAIVVAGDPMVAGGSNFCGQPATCGCNGLDCGVFHATRLWDFANMQMGSNGVTANLCAGAGSVPTAIQGAFEGDIDLACQTYEPPK